MAIFNSFLYVYQRVYKNSYVFYMCPGLSNRDARAGPAVPAARFSTEQRDIYVELKKEGWPNGWPNGEGYLHWLMVNNG